jgi:hypothetical protein
MAPDLIADYALLEVSRWQREKLVMKIDWNDKEQVIYFAKSLGKGQTVYKNPDRKNYNICHTVNEYRLDLSHVFIIHRT